MEACVLVRYQHLGRTRIFRDSLTIGPAGCSLHLTGPPASHSGGLVRSRTKSECALEVFSLNLRTALTSFGISDGGRSVCTSI